MVSYFICTLCDRCPHIHAQPADQRINRASNRPIAQLTDRREDKGPIDGRTTDRPTEEQTSSGAFCTEPMGSPPTVQRFPLPQQ